MGNILEVDLTTKTWRRYPTPPELASMFIGGRGLGTALLMSYILKQRDEYENPIAQIDPLSPDNVLVFATSPLNGTPVPTCARYHAEFKSPLTGGIGSSDSGGKWGVEFKRAGYDALVITGKPADFVELHIDENGVRFEYPLISIFGSVEKTTNAIERKYGRGVKVMTTGAAGWQKSPIAAIINDRGRALGRGGGGAVFASKFIFAIVVEGSKQVETAHPDMLKPKNISGSVYKALAKLRMGKLTKPPEQFGILSSMGTNGLMGMLAQYDELIHRNFQDNCHDPDKLNRIRGEAFLDHPSVKVKRAACYNCPIGCTRRTQIIGASGDVTESGEGPEFETVSLLGANLDIYDLDIITRANYLCNRYGFDTISMGGTIATLMEIYEIVSAKSEGERTPDEAMLIDDCADFVGKHGKPVFGNTKCLIPLIKSTFNYKDDLKTNKFTLEHEIGRYIAQGAMRLAKRYGHPECAMTVKGMEMPAYDPRATWTQALSYMLSARGACHLQGGYSAPIAFCAGYGEFPGTKAEGAALVARNAAYHNTAYDILGVCAFAGFSVTLDEFANMFNDVTGLDYNSSDLEKAARRTITLERMFNILCGMNKDDDRLPERFYNEPIMVEGKEMVCDRDEFAAMRAEYYAAMGWDENGHPTDATLDELGLSDIFDFKGLRMRPAWEIFLNDVRP